MEIESLHVLVVMAGEVLKSKSSIDFKFENQNKLVCFMSLMDNLQIPYKDNFVLWQREDTGRFWFHIVPDVETKKAELRSIGHTFPN